MGAFKGSTSSITHSLDSQVFNNLHDLRKAYILEQEKIQQQVADHNARTHLKETKYLQELAMPIVSLILLEHIQK